MNCEIAAFPVISPGKKRPQQRTGARVFSFAPASGVKGYREKSGLGIVFQIITLMIEEQEQGPVIVKTALYIVGIKRQDAKRFPRTAASPYIHRPENSVSAVVARVVLDIQRDKGKQQYCRRCPRRGKYRRVYEKQQKSREQERAYAVLPQLPFDGAAKRPEMKITVLTGRRRTVQHKREEAEIVITPPVPMGIINRTHQPQQRFPFVIMRGAVSPEHQRHQRGVKLTSVPPVHHHIKRPERHKYFPGAGNFCFIKNPPPVILHGIMPGCSRFRGK